MDFNKFNNQITKEEAIIINRKSYAARSASPPDIEVEVIKRPNPDS